MPDFFLTSNEMFAAFVELTEYVARVNLAAAGPINSVDGLQIVEGDTSGGGFTVTLEDPSLADPRWTCMIVNTGGNALTVDPGTALINGQAGTQIINDQWKTITLRHDGINFWVGDRLVPDFPGPETLSSFQLEYNIEDAFAAGAIWTDTGRTTLAIADDEIDNLDASFVVAGAASTPRADINGTTGKARLRTNAGAYLNLPPNGNPCLSMFKSGSDGGLDTDWHTVAPLDDLVKGSNTPWTVTFVARFYDTADSGGVFDWLGGDDGFGVASQHQIQLVGGTGNLFSFRRDSAGNTAGVNSTPNPVDGGWKTYTAVYDGARLKFYEGTTLLMDKAQATAASLDEYAGVKSAIGHLIGSPGGAPQFPLNWDMATMAFFNEALPDFERQVVTSYYNNRYGI